MKRKLIYVSFVRLTETSLSNFYIDLALKKNAEVEYWDICPLLRYEYDEIGTLDVEYLKYVKTFKEFENLLDRVENQEAIYVMLVTYQNRYLRPFKILSKRNLKMVYFNTGNMPTNKIVNKTQRVLDLFFNKPFDFTKALLDLISVKIHQKLNIVKPFEIEFITGESNLKKNSHAIKVAPINFFDFDNFQRIQNSNKRIISEKYALFIDSNAPYHSDNMSKDSKYVNPEKYFESQNRFIDLMESHYRVKIVIAGSPKSRYGSEKFNNREFYRSLTPELTKHCEYMIVPYSSCSISYAVLNVKPIIFTYSDESLNAWPSMVEEMEGIASFLNIDVFNSDKILNGNEVIIQSPDIEKYNLYKYNFLTSYQAENKASAQIFWDEISKL